MLDVNKIRPFQEMATIILNSMEVGKNYSRTDISKNVGSYDTMLYKQYRWKDTFRKLVEQGIIKKAKTKSGYTSKSRFTISKDYVPTFSSKIKNIAIKAMPSLFKNPKEEEKEANKYLNLNNTIPKGVYTEPRETLIEYPKQERLNLNNKEPLKTISNMVDIVKEYSNEISELNNRILTLSNRRDTLIKELANKLTNN